MLRRVLTAVFPLFLLAPLGPLPAYSYERTTGLTDKEILERLTRLEEGQKALNQRIEDLRTEMNNRFEDINRRFEDINRRFGDINRRFDDINRRFEDINKRFEDINRRFEDINKRFEDINKRFEDINDRFEDINNRIDKLIDIMIGIVAVFGGLVAATIGLVFWDRKTLLDKAEERAVKRIEADSRLINALRELAKKDEDLAKVMKTFGLL